MIEFHEASPLEAGVSARVRGDSMKAFDAALIQRALSNLLACATRFAERGSVIEINIEAVSSGGIRLSVHNVGPVIPTEHLPCLLDRFYRADQARENGDTDHGLGLAIVAAIARMRGGNCFVQSSGGRTTVGVCLPVGQH